MNTGNIYKAFVVFCMQNGMTKFECIFAWQEIADRIFSIRKGKKSHYVR